MNFIFSHKTPSSTIQIKLSLEITKAQALCSYENAEYFHSLCKTGCENYDKKWSCPPYCPTYSSYSAPYDYCLLTLFYCDLSQFDYIEKEYLKIRASNSILKAQAEKFSRFLEEELSGKMLSTGSCRLYKPCSKKLDSDQCNHPLKLRYSLESLGLDLSKVSEDYFGHALQWYQNKTAPAYSTTLSGVMTNKQLDSDFIKELTNDFICTYL
ncbi:MAG: DUF2284 domain-containing protein [Bacillota bacterium]